MFANIDKYIRFRGVVPLSDIKKEEFYRALDVVVIRYNKEVFTVKIIECDGEFKSIINEVSDDMEIEMNDKNSDNHVPESERETIEG